MIYVTSFIGGLLSFLSPCVLPLIPVFISFAASQSLEDLRSQRQAKILPKILIFISGFTVVFVILGMTAGQLGSWFTSYAHLIRYIGGAIVILFGLWQLGVLKVGFLNKQLSFSGKDFSKLGGFGVFIAGAAFAGAWTPCVGPILATILLIAANEGTAFKGFVLLLFYSLGFAIPLVIAALLINKFITFFNFIKKYFRMIEIISGLLLIAVGVLIITNWFMKLQVLIM